MQGVSLSRPKITQGSRRAGCELERGGIIIAGQSPKRNGGGDKLELRNLSATNHPHNCPRSPTGLAMTCAIPSRGTPTISTPAARRMECTTSCA